MKLLIHITRLLPKMQRQFLYLSMALSLTGRGPFLVSGGLRPAKVLEQTSANITTDQLV